MPKVDPKTLDEIIRQSGLGRRAAAKLRGANETEEVKRPRGHGAPAPAKVVAADL